MKNIYKKISAFILGLFLLALCLEVSLRIFGSRYEVRIPHVKNDGGAYMVLCAGDSFTQGTGVPPGGDYPRQLKDLLKARFPGRTVKVINMGQGGQNTALLLRRLPGALDEVKPDAVILLSGVANFWNYWGYNSGSPALDKLRDLCSRVRVFKLLKLFRREISPAPAAKNRELTIPLPKSEESRLCMNADTGSLLSANDVKKAIQLCKKAAALDPGDSIPPFFLGRVYIRSGQIDTGLAWLFIALKIEPKNLGIYTWLANVYETKGNRQEAEKWLKLGAIRSGGAGTGEFSGGLDVGAWIRSDLDKMTDLVRARGIKLIIQGYPDESPESRKVSEILRDAAAARSILFVDHAPAFERLIAEGRRDEYFLHNNPHCSARGYGLMAAHLADSIVKANFVESADK